MNSFELDQPLDLRLKALNLSRTLHYEPQKYPDQHQPMNHHHHILTNNLMMAAHCQSNSCSILPPIASHNNNNNNIFTNSNNNISSHQQILNPPPFISQHHANLQQQQQQGNMFQHQSPNNNYYQAHESPNMSPQTTSQYNQQQQVKIVASHQQQQQQQQNTQHPMMRSTNIHCQPLNHHQPHPLSSRLHPAHPPAATQPVVVVAAPPPPPPMSLTVQQQNHHHHQLPSTITTTSSPSNNNNNNSSLASPGNCSFDGQQSPQNYSHQTAAAAQLARHRQSTSPQHQVSFHHQPMPVRSLSMSAQMLSSSHLSHMVPPTLTPPVSSINTTNSSSNNNNANNHHVNSQSPIHSHGSSLPPTTISRIGYKSSGHDIPHQQLIKLSAAVSQAAGSLSSSYDSGISSSSNSNSSSSSLSVVGANIGINNNNLPTHNSLPNGATQSSSSSSSSSSAPSSSSSTTNNNNINDSDNINNNNNNSASPITRQHSLVSRYNCKPCGIVFSQPETLRAHQEGYCTKRDRGQTAQIRSQSAVSPSTVQQTAVNNASAGVIKGTSTHPEGTGTSRNAINNK